ncbi:MAG: hypothetical protein ABFC24_09705 [Methanoregulaceae archaeon]
MMTGTMDSRKRLRLLFLAMFCSGMLLVASGILLMYLVIPTGNPAGSEPGIRAENLPDLESCSSSEGISGGQISISGSDINQAAPPEQERTLRIQTLDCENLTPLGNATLFINGRAMGTTSSEDGSLSLSSDVLTKQIKTVRAVKTGYRETVLRQNLSTEGEIVMYLERSGIVPVMTNGPPESRFDVIFIPSNTSFNSSTGTKVILDGYPGGEKQFAADVSRFINNSFVKIPSITSPAYAFPADYQQKFNFYYYWDNETYADAFDGCAGKIPDSYWSEATFADVTVILYPTYYGQYTGAPDEPRGCTNPNGLGHVYLKIAADDRYLAIHELGHAVYGLMDTYYGNTYYAENDPDPNVWSSEENCKASARLNGWNPDACRQIAQDNPVAYKNFWRWDMDPDIMHNGYSGKFGNASTKRIVNILDKI